MALPKKLSLYDLINMESIPNKQQNIEPQYNTTTQNMPRPVIDSELEQENIEELKRKKGFLAKYGFTPAVMTQITGGLTALTGGNPYIASGIAQAGDRFRGYETEQEMQRKAHLADYIKDIKSKQSAYDIAQAKAAETFEIQQLEALQKEQEQQATIKQENIKLAQEREFKEKELIQNEKQLEIEYKKLDQNTKRIEADIKNTAQGKILPAETTTKIAENIASIDMLDYMVNNIENIKGLTFTPIDKVKALNPFDTGANQMKQLVASTKQVIGKGLEGGVLRKEDEYKYEKIIPNIGDTKEVLKVKYKQLRDLLVNEHRNTLKALMEVGYNTSNLSQPSFDTKQIFINKNFDSIESAEKANLPKGTIIYIKGRKAVVE